MYSKIKIFGHPIHPMLIAYPVAFYTGTLVGFCIYGATGDFFWLKATIALNLAGIVTAALAALPGFLDWLLGIPSGTDAKKDGLIHASFNVVSLALFTISFIAYAGHWNGPRTGAGLGIVLTGIGVLSTLAAGWYGWMLVQGHHVGVDLVGKQVQVDPTLKQAQAEQRKAS
ncbi:MAG: DUF2231 domain-containing protein [Actinomycetota bacterium]